MTYNQHLQHTIYKDDIHMLSIVIRARMITRLVKHIPYNQYHEYISQILHKLQHTISQNGTSQVNYRSLASSNTYTSLTCTYPK